ncbi:esterase [Pseudoxanthomonas gei]|uniref:Esterase n=1 Tax=Pseudoxanthomonas gei TaxID=1383030 RepID=A0ABX0A8P0_9GAMM|nr:PHB depolymerase family esterase [Pseudoxanthomonas gei]NDK37894.1 esterase [Pseudoxanthomonas gei]
MPLLSKLLARLPSPRRGASPAGQGDLESSISKTINDALAAAGLLRAPLPAAAPAQPTPGPAPATRPVAKLALLAPEPVVQPRPDTPRKRALSPGSFVEHDFSNEAGTRRYKLYIPAGYDAEATPGYPLLVMLHGCTQSPDDFAAGTRMNALADEHGFLVAYPAQSPNANGSKCWNWFRPGDQGREAGEPALLAGLTRQLIQQHAVDPRRVYVAGLSAGAAMAVILGTTHPELYAAVGAHSGLPYRAARDVPSAFAAMGGTHALREVAAETDANARQGKRPPAPVVPLIVFHGDADHTVAPANGEALVKQATGAASELLPESQRKAVAANGRNYTHSVYTTSLGEPLVEYWQVHGGGHAWFGGSSDGSYTDPRGPDASAEMVRFFLKVKQQHAPSAQ